MALKPTFYDSSALRSESPVDSCMSFGERSLTEGAREKNGVPQEPLTQR